MIRHTCKNCDRTIIISPAIKHFVCRCKSPNTQRLGDRLAAIIHYTGLAWLIKHIVRGKCGCEKRQEQLNVFDSKIRQWIKYARNIFHVFVI